jgi:thiol-disulfide isomerase/thioredoxin
MALRVNTSLPDLVGVTKWFNVEEGRTEYMADELKGSPVLVYFWSTSCRLCHEVAPQVQAWVDEWTPQGFKFFAVHHASSEANWNLEVIEKGIKALGMTQPVAADNDFKLVEAFRNEYGPAFYLFDKAGKMRYFHGGSSGFERLLEHMKAVVEEKNEA